MEDKYIEWRHTLDENPMWIHNQYYNDRPRDGMEMFGSELEGIATTTHDGSMSRVACIDKNFKHVPAYHDYHRQMLREQRASHYMALRTRAVNTLAHKLADWCNGRKRRDPNMLDERRQYVQKFFDFKKENTATATFHYLLVQMHMGELHYDNWSQLFCEKMLLKYHKEAYSKYCSLRGRCNPYVPEAWTPVRWDNAEWWKESSFYYTHLAHVSTTDPSMVSYCPSVEYMERERFVRVKPGRYLSQFFSGVLSPDKIKLYAESWNTDAKKYVLKFVENDDPDGWVNVYENGPYSCMKGEDCVRVYAYPGNGLRLAYMVDLDERIVGRAILRDDEEYKGYVRIYPAKNNSDDIALNMAMRELLAGAGYGSQINLDGVKVHRIWHDRGAHSIVMPYIDAGSGGSQSCSRPDHDDNYVTLGEDVIQCCSQEGYVGGRVSSCGECGCDIYDEEDMHTTYDGEGETVCGDCLEENYVLGFIYRRTQGYIHREDAIYCDDTGEYYRDSSTVLEWHGIGQCEHCGDYFQFENMFETDRGWMCDDHAVEIHEFGGFSYAFKGDTVELSDGSRCHVDDDATRLADREAA